MDNPRSHKLASGFQGASILKDISKGKIGVEKKVSKITSAQWLFNKLARLRRLDLCCYMKDKMLGSNGLKINFEALKNVVIAMSR